jgi:archaellum component FlaC
MSRKISSVHVEMSADSSKLEAGLKKAKGGLEDLKGKAQTVAKPVKDIKSILSDYALPIGAATAAFGALATASKMAFDAGKMGADLLYVQGKFDRLTASIGATSDALLKDLRAATKGMVSDAQLVQSAGDFMALGLAKSRDEVVRLTTVAGALGMDMNQLVLTLTNQTTMRFDALGVSVDGFDAKVKKLKDTGMDANAAFKEAFLQQAEAQLAKVGNKADTGAGAIARMDASVENLKNNLRMGLAPAVVSVANALNEMITNGQGGKDAINTQAEAVGGLSATYDDYVKKIEKVAREQGYMVRIVDGSVRVFNSSGMAVDYMFDIMSKSAFDTSRTVKYLDTTLQSASAAAREQALAMGDLLSPTDLAAVKAANLAEKARENARGMERWAEGVRNTKSALDILNNYDLNIADDITAELERIEWGKLGGPALEGAKGNLERLFAEGKIDKDQLAAGLTEIGAAAITLQGEIDGLTADQVSQEMAAQLKMPPEEAKAKVAELQAALDTMTAQQYIVKIIQQVSSVNVGATGQPTSGRPTGGPVFSGQSYIVGEHGPELFTPSSSGGVTANNRVGGGSPTINIYTLPGQSESAIAARVVAMLSRNSGRNRAGLGYAGA